MNEIHIFTKETELMERIMTEEMLTAFRKYLEQEERSENTILKYLRDVRKFKSYAEGKEVTKNLTKNYKNELLACGKYEVSSINSILTAMNQFLEFLGWYDAKVKVFKVQKTNFASENQYITKEEYKRLVYTARAEGKLRLAIVLNTICSTGIRISELEYFTAENVKRGKVIIHNKGKIRNILIPDRLKWELLKYLVQIGRTEGKIFCTKNGRKLDRSNIWREMKAICKKANVAEEKVFPHNFRHLFAHCFYEIQHDLAKLADVLGHGSIETTRIYIRTTCEEHLKQLEQIKLIC